MNTYGQTIKLLVILFTVVPISGCFFASGTKYDQVAVLHQSGNPVESTIVVQAHPWFTGNGHIPFDFTVYREDFIYKITVPDTKGSFNASDVRISICGKELSETELDVLAGQIFFDEKGIHFEIKYKFKNYPNESQYISKIKATLSLARSADQLQPCLYHSPNTGKTTY